MSIIPPPTSAQAAANAAALAAAQAAELPRTQMIDISKLPPEQAVAALINRAAEMGASDLFLLNNEGHLAAMVRHLGIMMPISTETPESGKRLLAHIRNMSGMDVSDRRRPADGRWIYRSDENSVDLRINTVPTLYGEDMAIRLLVRNNALLDVERLGMEPSQLINYRQMISGPSGLVLITGPTGSGKTSTLYATLMQLNDGHRKINTIEDPIEYAVGGLRQSQVNNAIDMGFAEILRSVLRQSPDVIMLGEIRDEETARTAVHAANSGLLVLATIHASTAAAGVQAMRGYNVPNHFLSVALRGVVSQRLVRTLDPMSRTEFDISHAPDMFAEVTRYLQPGEGTHLYAPLPSPSNQMTGYTSRTGIFEVMPIAREIRALIADGSSAKGIRDKAIETGMLEFRHAALLKVARGLTSTEEVFRVIPSDVLVEE
ncbi:MAG TPA: GspE/PulE family protein [Tepidisphaeraceae bacterium]|jgi:type II secretory ATPase GspE/PulE/Tfp pilus assembly ATPase PilB-like protein